MNSSFYACRVLLIMAAMSPLPAWAWGDLGHRAIGLIASRHLTLAAEKKVREILGSESLARASTYSDEIRSNPLKQVVSGQRVSYWHFVEVHDGATYETTPKNPEGNAYEVILKMKAKIAEPAASQEEKREALRWLVHLVGDVHQPLHVGNGRDHGANSCQIRWGNRSTNLHSLIDSGILNDYGLSFTELADFASEVSEKELGTLAEGDERAWIEESRALRDSFYPVAPGGNPRSYCGDKSKSQEPVQALKISGTAQYKYAAQITPVLERRILQAGLRLARVLNQILTE